MERFRKIVLVLLSICFVMVSLLDSVSFAEEKPFKIGFAQTKMNHPYRVAQVEWMKEAVEKLGRGWELVVTDAQDNYNKQMSDMEDLIVQECDIIICCPYTPDALIPACQAVRKAGIPLILLDRMINSEDYDYYLGGDNREIGRVVGADVVKRAEGSEAKVLFLNITLGASATIDRNGGFKDAIVGHENVKIVGDFETNSNRENAMKATEDTLIMHPDLFAVWGMNDQQAIGALQALRAVNNTTTLVYGADGTIEAFDLIKKGEMTGSVLYPTGGAEVVELIRKIVDGEPVERKTILPVPLVTSENVDEYYSVGIPSN